jgi:hypothetical protein
MREECWMPRRKGGGDDDECWSRISRKQPHVNDNEEEQQQD